MVHQLKAVGKGNRGYKQKGGRQQGHGDAPDVYKRQMETRARI